MADALDDFRAWVIGCLGHAPEAIEPGRLHRFPTNNRRADKAGFCKLFDDLRGGFCGDHRSGAYGTWSARGAAPLSLAERAAWLREIERAKAQAAREQAEAWARARERNSATWASCARLLPGDPVTLYLKGRGLALWPLPPVLRYALALPYYEDRDHLGDFPAMVAPVQAIDGRALALHRTYLTRDGRKADVPEPKKLTQAAGPLPGAAIRLATVREGVLGVAEGIETALAAFLGSGVPTWAAVSASGLAAFLWPDDVHELIVFADHDTSGAGQRAADELAKRATAAGLTVRVLIPAEPGDWLDVFNSGGELPGNFTEAPHGR